MQCVDVYTIDNDYLGTQIKRICSNNKIQCNIHDISLDFINRYVESATGRPVNHWPIVAIDGAFIPGGYVEFLFLIGEKK